MWKIVGIIGLIGTIVAGILGYMAGADRERVKCGIRITEIQRRIDAANAEIERLVKLQKEQIDAAIEARDEEARKREELELELATTVDNYERTLAAREPCLLTDADVNSLR